MKLNEKLIEQRKAKKLTQVKLAELAGVTRQAVSRWEVGDAIPSIDNLKYLSELYSVPVDYFLNHSEPEKKEKLEVRNEPIQVKGRKENRKKYLWIVGMLIGFLLIAVPMFQAGHNGRSGNTLTMSEIEREEVVLEVEGGFGFER